MLRSCFIAVPLPEEFREAHQAAQAKVAEIMPYARLDDPDTPHVTLYYLGDLAESALAEAATVTEKLLQLSPMELHSTGIDVFVPHRPGVVYLGFAPHPTLVQANAWLRDVLTDFRGHENDHDYTPHLTLARMKGNFLKARQDWPQLKEALAGLEWHWHAEEIVFYGRNDQGRRPYHRLAI